MLFHLPPSREKERGGEIEKETGKVMEEWKHE